MIRLSLCACLVTLALQLPAPAEESALKLPRIFGDHMVIQRDQPIPVWGWANPGESVTVSFAGRSASSKADDKGAWKVTLPAVKADGKAHTLTVSASSKIQLTDVLIGEVWLGSGQSNMEWSLLRSAAPKETIAAANHPTIRLFHIPKVQSKTPNTDVNAEWKVCSPKTVPNFSAVLYHFGVRLQKELDVPIGLINSSWGGSRIEPWTVAENTSGSMYNAMIAPIVPFALRGILWYQGESNVAEGLKYRDRMQALIAGWRRVWGQELPFFFVQIAPWSGYKPDTLPPLWEAQVATLKIPGTGMAVVTDLVDNIKDIHPANKLDVGNRLALWALAKTYGKKDLVYSGPLYKSMKIEGNKIRLSFAHVGGGLRSRDNKPLSDFQIAGEDGKFVPAIATIDGKTVVVHAEGVEKPTQVRFGWYNTCNPNLMNAEKLPASPFQTNNWQGGTGE
jgi:sialate O-acetylesterase